MGLEKVETAGREGCSQRKDAFQAALRAFSLIPRARDSGVASSAVCFRKCSLSALQRVTGGDKTGPRRWVGGLQLPYN